MTVTTSYSALTFNCNGSATAFSITWPFFLSSDLVVTHITSTGVETVLTVTTDYTVTGGRDTTTGLPAVGTVTTVATYASGVTLRVTRATPRTQSTSFTTSGAFPAKTVEAMIDRVHMIAEEGAGGAGTQDIDGSSLRLETSGATDYWDGESYIARGFADGVGDTDLVTVGQMDTAIETSLEVVGDIASNRAAAEAAQTAAEVALASLLANAAVPDGELTSFTRMLDSIESGFDGVETVFDLAYAATPVTPISNTQLLVFYGNSYQKPGTGYTVSGSEITFTFAPAAGVSCIIIELQAYLNAGDIAFSPTGTVDADDVQTAIAEVASEAATATGVVSSALAAHLADTVDSHDASAISFDATATDLTSITTVQAAIAELSTRVPATAGLFMIDSIAGSFNDVLTTFDLKVATAAFTPSADTNLFVTYGGVLQDTGSYSVSGSTITFGFTPATGVSAEIRAINV